MCLASIDDEETVDVHGARSTVRVSVHTRAVNIVGHRGASAAEKENTPAAFEAADRMGADGVELDVRIRVDGETGSRLVVCHDPLPVDPVAADALADLGTVLRACGARMLINVEIKNSVDDGGFDPTMAVVEPTVEAMLRHDPDPARWLVSSFSIETIDRIRDVAPDIPTAYLCHALDERTISITVERGHRAIHPWAPAVEAHGVEAAHDAGLVVNTWTVNDPDRIVELAALGVDGVCTDVPDIARRALGLDAGYVDATPTWGINPVGGGRPA